MRSADNVPRRDLWISPNHAMYLDGVLIEARDLLNGVSIVQAERVNPSNIFTLSLKLHDVIVAEGAFSETFIDDDSRAMFHNAHDYRGCYPDAIGWASAILRAPLPMATRSGGTRAHRVTGRVARAADSPRIGSLSGYVDLVSRAVHQGLGAKFGQS